MAGERGGVKGEAQAEENPFVKTYYDSEFQRAVKLYLLSFNGLERGAPQAEPLFHGREDLSLHLQHLGAARSKPQFCGVCKLMPSHPA